LFAYELGRLFYQILESEYLAAKRQGEIT